MSKHDYFQKLLSGEIVSDEEYKKIIIIKLNKHLVMRMFVSRGVCMCIHPPTHTHTHTHTDDDARLLGPGQRLAAGLSNDAASNVAIPHFFLLTNFNLEESEHNHSMVMRQVPGTCANFSAYKH